MVVRTNHDPSSAIAVHSSELPVAPVTDPLSEILQGIRLSGVAYGRCELAGPWGMAFAGQRAARFHVVASGSCWLHGPLGDWTELRAGDAVLLPRGSAHVLADLPTTPARPIGDFSHRPIADQFYGVRAGEGAPVTLLFCGSILFDAPALHPLADLLPEVLYVTDAASADPSLLVLLDMMADEVIRGQIGTATVLTRLADVLTIRLIRRWMLSRHGETTGVLTALRDPAIGQALLAVHRCPGGDWSLAALAGRAGMSRSAFAERFMATVGIAPATYVARWRMQLANTWLRDEQITVADAASRLGYRSESSFSRAFKRLVGFPPGQVRQNGRPLPALPSSMSI